jgi:glycosyltransferase involved in cell wall biosynthesis
MAAPQRGHILRILMLSKACLVGIYQTKLEAIARQPDVSALRVLVPPFWKDERGTVSLERAHVDGYDLSVTPIRFNGNFHLHHYPEFASELKNFAPDVVHIDEEPYNVATWLALRATMRFGAKSLFFSWQNIRRNYPPPFILGERWVLRHVDYALVGTESAARVWREKGYAGKLAVIPQFGVDPGVFSVKNQSGETVCIGYIGRLVHDKGIDLLLRSLAQIEGGWHLEIVGGGPQEDHLRALVSELGLADKVHFRGQVPSLEMPAHYQKLDILVIPSRTLPNWKEQFGRVIVEAMASGVAVIGSDSGAIPDVIGDAGLVFREDDAEDLRDKLRSLINDAGLRQSLAEKGRQRVLDRFTQQQVAEQTVAIYQEMVEKDIR